MPTFERCPKTVETMADELLKQFESHAPVLHAKVKIDFVFAYADRDPDSGELLGDALKKNGIKALGITRNIALKDRALGRGDAEIALDGDWWQTATEKEQAALLDHELHHIAAKIDKRGFIFDDLGRPKLQLRKHDVEVGWFRCIAERHGVHSLERIQAKAILEVSGQYFWPELCGKPKLEAPAPRATPLRKGRPQASV